MSVDELFLAFQEAVVGQYSLQRELGRGGMGVVYLAREIRLDRSVAIKLLPPALSANAQLRDRFVREARTAARLSHPNIVPIHSVDDVAGFVFYVMAYVDGETLAQRVMARGPMQPAEATRVLREVAWALSYAHSQGVIHRDIKPANILLERGTGRAMVADFGIARMTHSGGETGAGEFLGTPEYMSPEQASGESVDARSDIYSLGVVSYYAVSGTLPFSGASVQAVLRKQITEAAPPVASVTRALPRSLAAAIDQCLQKDASERIQSGEALADALAPALEMRAELPVPIRSFLDARRMGALLWYPVLTLVPAYMFMFGIGRDIERVFGFRPGVLFVYGAGLLLTSAAVPLVLVTRWLRPLLRLGYGVTDIASGLRANFDRKREEHHFEGVAPSRRERVLTAVTIATASVNVASWLALYFGSMAPWMPAVIFSTGFIWPVIGLLSASTARMRTGAGSWWAKRWDGVLGRWLTKLASIKLGPRAAAADRPTELAIAISAQALFDELPKDVRRALGDVPTALRELERQSAALRTRVTRLDESIAEVQRATFTRNQTRGKQDALLEDLHETRKQAESRLADLVTALETMRLDLLRLRAGHGSADGITLNLLAAKALGEDVDRLLSGQAEVDAVLRHRDTSVGRETTPV